MAGSSLDQNWITAFEALKEVYLNGAYSNLAVNEAISHHRRCRDSFVRILAKGTLRDTILLDHLIDDLADRGKSGIKPRVLIILRMGIYAIRSMDSVPDHAAVNEAVNLARAVAKGSDRFVNALLRSYIRRRSEIDRYQGDAPDPADISDLAVRYSFPEDIAGMIFEQYGDEAEPIMKGLNMAPPLMLRVNTLKTGRDELISLLREEGFSAEASRESERAVIAEGTGIISSKLYNEGLFSVQGLSSITAVSALGPEAGSRVLDMCAAPGGKSALMAEIMCNTGSITSCDIHAHRLDLIDRTAERLGIGIISTGELDGTVFAADFENSFDYVLADVPCSGLGVAGSKPEIKYRTDISGLGELYDIQEKILINAMRYTRPGGRLEYSTCTINKRENEEIVNRAMKSVGSFMCVEMRTFLPYNQLTGFYYCILEKNN